MYYQQAAMLQIYEIHKIPRFNITWIAIPKDDQEIY